MLIYEIVYKMFALWNFMFGFTPILSGDVKHFLSLEAIHQRIDLLM